MSADYVDAFVGATNAVFSQMLDCDVVRGTIRTNEHFHPQFDISGIIGLSGKRSGNVVVSLHQNVALNATEAMLGSHPDGLDNDVVDTVGELTNMIAGRAKATLSQFAMNLAIPTVITGRDHLIKFGSRMHPIVIPFESAWGPFTVEVGLTDCAV